MSNPIWAVELSWGEECYHTHFVRYFNTYEKDIEHNSNISLYFDLTIYNVLNRVE